MKIWFTVLLLVAAGCRRPLPAHEILIMPLPHAEVAIGNLPYTVSFQTPLQGPVKSPTGIRLQPVDGEMSCGDAASSGQLYVNGDLAPLQQAKTLIHETVHIAETCDQRNMATDEKIAEDVSDMLGGPEGPFIAQHLRR